MLFHCFQWWVQVFIGWFIEWVFFCDQIINESFFVFDDSHTTNLSILIFQFLYTAIFRSEAKQKSLKTHFITIPFKSEKCVKLNNKYLNKRAIPAPIVIETGTQCAKAKSSGAVNKSPLISRKTKSSAIFCFFIQNFKTDFKIYKNLFLKINYGTEFDLYLMTFVVGSRWMFATFMHKGCNLFDTKRQFRANWFCIQLSR